MPGNVPWSKKGDLVREMGYSVSNTQNKISPQKSGGILKLRCHGKELQLEKRQKGGIERNKSGDFLKRGKFQATARSSTGDLMGYHSSGTSVERKERGGFRAGQVGKGSEHRGEAGNPTVCSTGSRLWGRQGGQSRKKSPSMDSGVLKLGTEQSGKEEIEKGTPPQRSSCVKGKKKCGGWFLFGLRPHTTQRQNKRKGMSNRREGKEERGKTIMEKYRPPKDLWALTSRKPGGKSIRPVAPPRQQTIPQGVFSKVPRGGRSRWREKGKKRQW